MLLETSEIVTVKVDEYKYDLKITSSTNGILILAKDTIGREKYELTQNAEEIAKFTKEYFMELSTLEFYNMLVAGFKNDKNILCDYKLNETKFEITVKVTIESLLKLERTFKLALTKIDQKDSDRVARMLLDFYKTREIPPNKTKFIDCTVIKDSIFRPCEAENTTLLTIPFTKQYPNTSLLIEASVCVFGFPTNSTVHFILSISDTSVPVYINPIKRGQIIVNGLIENHTIIGQQILKFDIDQTHARLTINPNETNGLTHQTSSIIKITELSQ